MASVGSLDSSDLSLYLESSCISLGETPDPLQMSNDVKKPLAERVVIDRTFEKTTRYKLDRCLKIDGPSEQYSKIMTQQLQNERTKTRAFAGLTGVVVLLAWATSSYWILTGSVGLLFFLSLRGSLQNQKIQFYNTSIYEEPAEQRKLAYQEPFHSIYVSHLKWTPSNPKGVLHPNEVEYLYKKHLNEFAQKLLLETPSTDQEKQTWLVKFFTLNPLSPSLMRYGLREIPPSFAQMHQEYTRLSPEKITYETLRLKFPAPIGPIGPIGPVGRIGLYSTNTYLYKLEGIVVDCEKKIEGLQYGYLRAKERLDSFYGTRLNNLGPEASLDALETLNNRFEYDLKQLKDPYILKTDALKAKYLEDLQKLKSRSVQQEPHSMEERLEKRWDELQVIFEKDKTFIYSEDLYQQARTLLTLAKRASEESSQLGG